MLLIPCYDPKKPPKQPIGDSDFTSGIQFMIKENIMIIPDLPEEVTQMELKDEKRAMGMERKNCRQGNYQYLPVCQCPT